MKANSLPFSLSALGIAAFVLTALPALAQTGPSATEINAYQELHETAHKGDLKTLQKLIRGGARLEAKDGAERTPLHVVAFASHEHIVEALARAGAKMNALEHQAYDIVTIAAVANDLPMLQTALKNGASAKNITSPYDGTALIAAAHLGHHRMVKTLIDAGAPLDHINNLRWTALIEAVILGDGGKNHIECVRLLLATGADKSIADSDGVTPLQHAENRGYAEMVQLLR